MKNRELSRQCDIRVGDKLYLSEWELAFWAKEEYPVTIIHDRYGGSYSGALYTAWPFDFWKLPKNTIDGSDIPCMDFWSDADSSLIGKGRSPQTAMNDLRRKIKARLGKRA